MLVKLTIPLIVIFVAATTTMAAEITLVADPWPPFNNEVGDEQEGYIVDVARTVFEAAGHTVIYKNVPWKKALAGTRSGFYSSAIGVVKEEARDFIFPDEELGHDVVAFFVRKESNWKFEGSSSIDNVSIGVIAGAPVKLIVNHQE